MELEELLTYECPFTGKKRVAGVRSDDDHVLKNPDMHGVFVDIYMPINKVGV